MNKWRMFALAASTALVIGACRENRSYQTATNTGINERDRSGASLTAQDQPNTESDRVLTQRVRQALMATDALSTNARNVKIITVDGVVTLRGPVDSGTEKARVAAAAAEIAGVSKVNDQLDVAQ